MKPAARQRIDQILVERGLVETRAKAQALILAGSVLINGQKAEKAGQSVAADSEVRLLGQLPFVSRGGVKLDGALGHFRINPRGKTCLDIGASTGGFTDCLLQRFAARVYAVDVGSTQLDWKLRTDPRVVVRDHTNARHLQLSDIGEQSHLAVCDVSFISVTLILPVLPPLLTPDGEMVILVKPQFEVGRGDVGKGGIVRDPDLHEAACRKVSKAVEHLGFAALLMESPIRGAGGNREFLLHAKR
ncbi:MAG: TlyA family RNA methyltransferase [Bryobacteraceae bacterium]|nr:TlyA family RNA methyltransferase [Bryobacteraceae bacterium]